MEKQWNALGVMSGTSLDGIDLCYCRFELQHERWTSEVLKAKTVEYSPEWIERLQFNPHLKASELLELNHEYGLHLGEVIKQFLQENGIDQQEVDLIGSHGHTLYHQPEKGYTCQIGNGADIHVLTGVKTIADFRSQDVSLGGQGAPLVPAGDELLFGEYDACINLGGFANISYREKQKRQAYDIAPVNFVLNHLALREGHKYDAGGAMARSGKPDHELLKKLNALPFYNAAPPKSLGAEWVNQYMLPILTEGKTADLLRTFTEHAAYQVSSNLNKINAGKVLATGGGAYNEFLMELIQFQTKSAVTVPSLEIVEFKEAIIFAFMAVLKSLEMPNTLSSVTGATHDHSAGMEYNFMASSSKS